MASGEVAPCMPLQIFRRTPRSRPRLVEVARRLSEGLKSLAAAAPSSGSGSGEASDELSKSVSAGSEDIQKQLQTILQVFTETADAAERNGDRSAPSNGGPRRSSSGGYSSSASSGGGAEVSGAAAVGKQASSVGANAEEAGELLSQLLALDIPARLVANLDLLDFEVRKDVISVFSAIVRLGPNLGADLQITEYARKHPRFFELLVDGYSKPEVATHCGVMLRSCARHRKLVEAFFARPQESLKLLSYTQDSNFDISSDAFSSIHDFLLTQKAQSAVFLEANFKDFFAQYNKLLAADASDYVTQRQALKLLSEMLLNRTFMRVMLAYVGDPDYLQIHMNLLRENSKAIQFEAFHVFKIFVANPQKPPRVQQILHKNKEKLIKILESLRSSRQDDRQFIEDRNTVMEKLQVLELPTKPAAAQAGRTASGKTPTASASPSGSGGEATAAALLKTVVQEHSVAEDGRERRADVDRGADTALEAASEIPPPS